jgi:4-methyl-5(b-hydroxyethyl)-thiazole monophosphate biosynthesis
MLKKQRAEGRMIAAICAAPAVVLHPLGLLGDEKTSGYPAFQRRLDEANRTEERLRVGEKLITAAGPGVAMEFALALAEILKGKEKTTELAKAMLVEGSRCNA